jgi:hypothetical protein
MSRPSVRASSTIEVISVTAERSCGRSVTKLRSILIDVGRQVS